MPRRAQRPERRVPVLLLLLALIVSCAGTAERAPSGTGRVIQNVPFYPQEAYQCGPASLAGVLNYWGVEVTPGEIAEAVYSASAGGTLDVDLVFYAERRGLRASQYRGGIADLKDNIDAGRPLVVLVDYGFWMYEQNHFMVVAGYDDRGIIANSGKDRLTFIPLRKFLKSWEKTDFWTLRITPE